MEGCKFQHTALSNSNIGDKFNMSLEEINTLCEQLMNNQTRLDEDVRQLFLRLTRHGISREVKVALTQDEPLVDLLILLVDVLVFTNTTGTVLSSEDKKEPDPLMCYKRKEVTVKCRFRKMKAAAVSATSAAEEPRKVVGTKNPKIDELSWMSMLEYRSNHSYPTMGDSFVAQAYPLYWTYVVSQHLL